MGSELLFRLTAEFIVEIGLWPAGIACRGLHRISDLVDGGFWLERLKKEKGKLSEQ